ncbi:MAG TPA: ATP-dependent DNA helicase [Candidatus Limnocylindrales bacterium]|nr:ATP-dependent DNA helicase [Candidatus Limnocylindrales bacterium]
MPPVPPVPDPMIRTRDRRRRRPLEQIPVWQGFEPAAAEAPAGQAVGFGDIAGLTQLLDGLNTEQRRAVTHGEGPLLVVAGAGTGKTQVITRRIAWLIATRRAKPSEILALTFTDKAAEEMQLRVDQLVPYGYADTAISTFHAFGDRVIREFAFELGLAPDARVLTRAEVIVFLRERLFELGLQEYRPLGDPTRFLGALAQLFARCRDEDVSPAAYVAHAERLLADAAALAGGPGQGIEGDAGAAAAAMETARRQAELAGAFERYATLIREHGAIDFGDQVALALQLLRDSAAARESLQGRYRYVLVDEFQDTNRAQSELVALLAERHRNVTVVGDDDQSIYRFRGAAISNILEFRDRYRAARTVVLRRNYRSLAPILDGAHRLIRFNDPDRLEVKVGISKRLVAERSDRAAPPIRHHVFPTAGEEADWIAGEIRRRVEEGSRPREFAVLVRANADADPVLRSLTAAGLPWRFSGTSGLYSRPEIRLLLALLRAVADPASSVDVYAIAASDRYAIPAGDLGEVAGSARRRHRSIFEILEELEDEPGILRLTPKGRAALARLTLDLRRYQELAHRRPAGEVLYAFLRDTGWLGELASAESVAAEEQLANIGRFFDLIRNQSSLLADDRAVFLARHLATLIEAGDDPATADPDPDVDAVHVMTVHKAKGLEFPVVFLPGLVADRFPARSRREPLALPVELVDEVLPEGDGHLQEERRLFYVAMTRARDELILSHASESAGGRARRVSPFVIEALDLPTAGFSGALPTSVHAAGPLERIAAAQGPVAAPDAERTPIDGPLTLSHSAIDDYLSCPLRYKYSQVVRVPTTPHHSMIYGAALHKAVQEFHRSQSRGRPLTEPELVGVFEAAWSNEGFVSREHEAARLEAGKAALRQFREAQLLPGAVVPAWVEREFAFALGGNRVRGRFDRVDIVPVAASSATITGELPALPGAPAVLRADVVEPMLELLGPEEVTITDYKSSDVRDPVVARQRARDSLQLQIYAMAYEAMTGRLPDAVQLHFLDSGLVGRAEVEPARLEKARTKIDAAAAGIRSRNYTPKPSTVTCTYCPFRDICPSSVAR